MSKQTTNSEGGKPITLTEEQLNEYAKNNIDEIANAVGYWQNRYRQMRDTAIFMGVIIFLLTLVIIYLGL